MVKRISIVLCQVTDMNRAVAFYRDLLGMEPGVTSPYWSDLSVGDVKVGLHPPFAQGPREIGRGWIIGVEVDDLNALRQRLETAGTRCEPFHDIPGGVVMDFSDPDGNPIEAMQLGATSAQLAGN